MESGGKEEEEEGERWRVEECMQVRLDGGSRDGEGCTKE